ncbi:hypothetical protein TSAR_009939 [Trichomalopsis sarcophagae]|uniref:Uncharacterized protein n=1 Tax=Trichomalopsis sarcophagae TaxID=543379 RepID=A0A232EHG5_9HYME|nr:hypothetical protein TSAR_009939 [Trichomalopsis sarcophagae]
MLRYKTRSVRLGGQAGTGRSSAPRARHAVVAREQLFTRGHSRHPSGRYIVLLLLKGGGTSLLGESLTQARIALSTMYRHMQRDPKLGAEYVKFMTTDPTGKTASISLMWAKSKLSPIRSLIPAEKSSTRMTIPRLELRAALLAARLFRYVATGLDVPPVQLLHVGRFASGPTLAPI